MSTRGTHQPDELAAMLMAFDKNHDGKLTKLKSRSAQGVFARADENKDGVLTVDEIKAAAAAQPQPTAAGRGREGEGRGGPPGAAILRDGIRWRARRGRRRALSADEIAAAPAALKSSTRTATAAAADECSPAAADAVELLPFIRTVS